MMRTWLRRMLSCAPIIAIAATVAPLTAKSQSIFEIAILRSQVAQLHREGKFAEATTLAERLFKGSEQMLGKDHTLTLASANELATLNSEQGNYSKAEALYKRALEGYERTVGKQHSSTLIVVNNLAGLYREQGRYGEAEPLYLRALEGLERTLGKEHRTTLSIVGNLAALYDNLGRFDEAEPFSKRVLEAIERAHGKDDPSTIRSINNLAVTYDKQGRANEAEPLLKSTLETAERVLGKEHPDTLRMVNNLAMFYHDRERYAEAEPLHKRALEASERVLGKEHPLTLYRINILAALYYRQRNWSQAAAFWRESTGVLAKQALRGGPDTSEALSGKKKSEALRNSSQFSGLVKVVYRVAAEDGESFGGAAREMFQTAQWALGSEAAQSLAQMAARGAKRDPKLAALVRERQDLVLEWQKRDGLRNAALGQPAEQRIGKAESENTGRLAAIDARVVEIDKRLATAFPDYTAFAHAAPLSVEGVQGLLAADEALVLFLDTPEAKPAPEETFIWVVTKTDMRWVRSDLGRAALAREVKALRCGLDRAAWRGQSRCPELTGKSSSGELPSFDYYRSHGLYKSLFGQAEDIIGRKHLLIVPSGALTQLPFAVLVTAPPANGDQISAPWIARDHALTILPAVSSLKALRATGHPSAATKPLIGFGNPLLDGGDKHSKPAKLALEKQTCPKTLWQRVAALLEIRDAVPPIETRGELADVSLIKALSPLPETADELCAVGRDIGADINEMHLGSHATEAEVKAMSESGNLAQYRIVHFATHGAMAGELKNGSEPGLILTPPEVASETDDGYLTASEIAGLKLDADWVILSACNTAAGDAPNSEALSGLARAFIYAQARAILVSHWAVDSNATVTLITSAMRQIARDKTVGRAEALRRAMLTLIDSGDPVESHPAFWAPFIVVGEGGR